jgi:hypothetical protein
MNSLGVYFIISIYRKKKFLTSFSKLGAPQKNKTTEYTEKHGVFDTKIIFPPCPPCPLWLKSNYALALFVGGEAIAMRRNGVWRGDRRHGTKKSKSIKNHTFYGRGTCKTEVLQVPRFFENIH